MNSISQKGEGRERESLGLESGPANTTKKIFPHDEPAVNAQPELELLSDDEVRDLEFKLANSRPPMRSSAFIVDDHPPDWKPPRAPGEEEKPQRKPKKRKPSSDNDKELQGATSLLAFLVKLSMGEEAPTKSGGQKEPPQPRAALLQEAVNRDAAQAANPLLPHHREMLMNSGISPEVIVARGYRSITDPRELLNGFGFSPKQARAPGLLIPLHSTDGGQPFQVYRPDSPRERNGGLAKYEVPAKQGMRLDCPPTCREQLANPQTPLWLTEGQKKGDALASFGQCAIALLGVWNFKGENAFGGVTLLADFDYIAFTNREVRLVFDNDLMRNPKVRSALDRLTEHLQRKGAMVRAVYLPLDGPKGVDDYLASGKTISDLEALIETPRPQPQAAPPIAELLDNAPLTMRRPLALIDGRAYAAIWPYVKVTIRESLDKKGEIVRHDPPKIENQQRLLIVRDDGKIFGDGGDEPFVDLGIDAHLPEIPPAGKLWSTPAVKAYRNGSRPDPVNVFSQVVSIYDYYLDFSRSLSNQGDMCALSACLSLMTWFSEAFDVMPYPWANGEWGSGKTKWGTIWAMSSYLGQVLTMGGSFAALRDMADYGAAMLFDDAENLEDKHTDPEKKALLLAGNRRGAEIPLKETAADKVWRTRWVNAYCPRGFTAKKRPYGALETRALLIPLIRTDNQEKGNRDPVRTEGWPVPPRSLQDDLWAVALILLPKAKATWTELDKETSYVGRFFEVWRAPLAVARLFESLGVKDLEATIRRTIELTTQEKRENPSDHTTKVVEAMAALIFGVSDVSDVSDKSDVCKETLTAEEIVKKIGDLASDVSSNEEGSDSSWATTKRVGWILSSLRIPKKIDTSTKKKTRLREVKRNLMLSLLRSYGYLSYQTSETLQTSETSDDKQGPSVGGSPDSQGWEDTL